MVFGKKKKQDGLIPSSKPEDIQRTDEQEIQRLALINEGIEKSEITQKNTLPSENSSSEVYGDEIRKYEDSELFKLTNQYKPFWNKNGIIQYKTDRIAILQRAWGRQVEFIIAFDDLTREGYRLMAIDEGKQGGQSSGGFTGGVNAYFYFQKMKYVK
ncbi:MAG TPA: hypothetical protein VD731_06425 [Nitrosopumilaceae archaeon]|nr:hypothetical protein [Nitrosopumilaceae archaeon]